MKKRRGKEIKRWIMAWARIRRRHTYLVERKRENANWMFSIMAKREKREREKVLSYSRFFFLFLFFLSPLSVFVRTSHRSIHETAVLPQRERKISCETMETSWDLYRHRHLVVQWLFAQIERSFGLLNQVQCHSEERRKQSKVSYFARQKWKTNEFSSSRSFWIERETIKYRNPISTHC